MVTIATPFKDLMLLSDLSDLNIHTDADAVTVTIGVYDTGKFLMQETYVPDTEGHVIIRDLADIAERILGSDSMKKITIVASAGVGNVDLVDFYVLYCRALVPQSYVTDHFLTAASGFEKMTYIGAEEILYLTSGNVSSTESISVNAEINYYDPLTQTVSTKNILVNEVQANDKVVAVNVSPYFYLAPYLTLLDYTIRAGQRSQKYVVMRNLNHPVSFRFRNRFGMLDSAHCFGTIESQIDVTRSTASVNRQQKTYKVVYYPTWVIKSGLVTEGSLQSVLDVLTSEEVTMLLDGYTFQVVVTDHKTTITDDSDALNEIELTVQQGASNRMPVRYNSTGIFDNTFDNTYN